MTDTQQQEARAAKRNRGQCCHEHVVGNTTYYCVEPAGHQCAHSYRPSMHEIERMAKRISDLERELEEARKDAQTWLEMALDYAGEEVQHGGASIGDGQWHNNAMSSIGGAMNFLAEHGRFAITEQGPGRIVKGRFIDAAIAAGARGNGG